MKYSLRSLMILAMILPPLLAVVIWQFLPAAAQKRGTHADMAAFLRVVKEPYPSEIGKATDKCFVVGVPASRYEAVFAKADKIGAPDEELPYAWELPTGKRYVFWCEGKAPGGADQEGDAFVVVITDGEPPTITHACLRCLTK